jgi:HK97 family phage portal protein
MASILDFFRKQRKNDGEGDLFTGMVQRLFGYASFASDNPKDYIVKGYAGNSTIYSIISAMSRKFGTVPWVLKEVVDEDKLKQYIRTTKNGGYDPRTLATVMTLRGKALKEVGPNDFERLMEKPNGAQSGCEFREQMYAHKLAQGAAPIYMNTGAVGTKPLAMYNLGNEYIKLWPDESLNLIEKAAYTISGYDYMLKPERFIYWKYHNPNYDALGTHLYGLSPLRAALKNMSADNYGVEAMASLYENRGANGVFTPVDKPVAQGAPADALRKDLNELLDGYKNRGKMPYVNKQLQFLTYGMSAQELQLLEARRLVKEDFCNIYNYPIVLLVANQSTDNNLKHSVKYVLTNSIYADLVSWREVVNNIILPAFFGKEEAKKYYYDFDLTEMPEMADDIDKVVAYLRDAWWITPNEKRMVMKYEALDEEYMDTVLVPKTFVPIDYLTMEQSAAGDGSAYSDEVTNSSGKPPDEREPQERGQ